MDALLACVRSAADAGTAPALQLTGIDVASKQLVAAHVAAGLGLRLERVGLSALPAQGVDLEAWCRLWRRECRLLPLALYIDAHDLPTGESSDASAAGWEGCSTGCTNWPSSPRGTRMRSASAAAKAFS